MSEKSGRSRDQRFWRAMSTDIGASKPDAQSRHIELTSDLSDLNAEQREERRQALMNMLEATQSRQQGARRNRRPTMEPGQRVAVISGLLMGKAGIVIDADFIHSRVQLEVDGMPELQWVSFKRVGAVES